ncbi:calmodulin-binding receptor-like cytoplasmic kinase 2 [Cannabis sativa]|uniref:calmodulin-binding receptor-like cytoplasmic kinase 2 n=1 Tax=Cannabis sativa TaxID=3483 RepID=UPI0029CA0829|nr:calmodulin-binding receptor-like cytoplasmic kinase 2 [Cannabis sativa]
MKKSPIPYSPQLNQNYQFSKSKHGDDRNESKKKGQSSQSALSYIRAAAKKFAGIITLAFLFKQSKASLKATNNGQFRGVSTPSDISTGSYSRNSSSKYRLSESYGSNGGAASGKIGTPNFTFAEINKATQKFSLANKLGEGGFGAVYKGLLQNGTLIAVKRAKKKTYDRAISAEFSNEILTLSTIEHMNLVRLYGYLEHEDERIIVVEYVGNGTLREHLDGKRGDGLEMAERLDIATDVAHAVTYLHMYTDPPIIHRDIKASNILITEKLRAKVADFGFARRTAEQETDATHISTQVKGTAGYLDPEYLRTYQLTDKSDVYSFGVLLVELMTGRQPIETKKPDSERLTLRWAMQKLKHGEPVLAMDPRLRRNPASNMALERVLKLAQECVAPLRNSRPSMKKCGEVLWEIRKEFREKAFPPHPPPTSHHSSNFPQGDPRFTRHITFGIEDDSYKFISA